MAKVNVKVCLGTTCFEMDGSNLQELNKIIPKKYGKEVNLEEVNCLGLCSINWENSKAPYIKVNEKIISEATIEKVLEEIEKQLIN